MQEKSIQRCFQTEGQLIVENIEKGKHSINGFVKIRNYTYQFLEDEITTIRIDKNNGIPINKKTAIKVWNALKRHLKDNLEEAHYMDNGKCYRIKPNGSIHVHEDIEIAEYCSKKYPDKLIYIEGVLYFKPKYKIMLECINYQEVQRDTGIKTCIKGNFNPKQELISINTDPGFTRTDENIETLKNYLISRQIKVTDDRYKITGYGG